MTRPMGRRPDEMFDENSKDPGLQAGRRAWALVALLMVLAIVALVTLTAR